MLDPPWMALLEKLTALDHRSLKGEYLRALLAREAKAKGVPHPPLPWETALADQLGNAPRSA